MALQSSGAISLGDLQTEFGGSNPISVSEYYLGGTYVPTEVATSATVSNFSYTESQSSLSTWNGGYTNFWRWYESSVGQLPTTNSSGNYLYRYSHWTDQAWTKYEDNWVDSTMTVDVGGDYTIEMGGYNTGATRSMDIYVNGSLVTTLTSIGSYNLTIPTGATLRIKSHMNTIGNFNELYCVVTTDNGNTTVDATVNTGVPSSGEVALTDYYGGQKTY